MHRSPISILDDVFSRLQMAAREANASPTAAQAEAGNYRKGRITLHSLAVTLENAHGSVRSGTSADGKSWSNRMAAHYGEFAGTVGADGDAVDVFIGPFPESRSVWVINQGWPDGGFDEHKVMLGFPTEGMARDAYMASFDRGWNGLQSIVQITLEQLKWWLVHGAHSRPLSLDQLPFDGAPSMTKTLWDSNAQPLTPMHKLMYELRSEDAGGLLLDAVTMPELMADPDVEAIGHLDALVVQVARMTQRMDLLQRVMNMAGEGVTVTGHTISDPVRSRGVMQVAVLFAMSDGQAVTVWFHNPDSTPAKITPMDELISWKWMLNKKDITIVVAPERGRELMPKEVARRIMRLVQKNSAAFQKANAKLAERMASLAALDTEIEQLETRYSEVRHEIDKTLQRLADKAAAPKLAVDVTTPEGYRLILAGDQALALENQDALDSMFQERYVAVRNALRELGWGGSTYGTLSKDGSTLVAEIEHIGAGKNVVGILYGVKLAGGDAVEASHQVRDTLEQGPAELAATVDALVPAAKSAAEVVEDTYLPDGWGESEPGGMATNPDPAIGGIVDRELLNKDGQVVKGEWFVVANDEAVAAALSKDKRFATRREAFDAFAAAVEAASSARSAALVTAIDEAQAYAEGLLAEVEAEAAGLEHHSLAVVLADFREWVTSSKWTPNSEEEPPTPANIREIADAKAKNARHYIADVKAEAQAAAQEAAAAIGSAIAKVDAAYAFANASTPFKVLMARSVDADYYSAFKSAVTIDAAVIAAGGSVAWDVSAVGKLDGVAEAAKPYLPEGSVLDFAGDVSAAIVQLQIALDVVTTNEPINRAEGKVEQADLERDNAEQFRNAIGVLQEAAMLDGAASDEDDFDAEAEFDAIPLEDPEQTVLDGDFPGHPFRGNQYIKAGAESGAAVKASMRAKHHETKGNTKEAKKAHRSAALSHKAAEMHSKGAAKAYHRKMAKFHGSRSGSQLDGVLDDSTGISVPAVGAMAGEAVGRISHNGAVIGRAQIMSGDGKAMIYLGAKGSDRVKRLSTGNRFMFDDEPEELQAMVAALFAAVKPSDEPAPTEADPRVAMVAGVAAELELLGWFKSPVRQGFSLMSPRGSNEVVIEPDPSHETAIETRGASVVVDLESIPADVAMQIELEDFAGEAGLETDRDFERVNDEGSPFNGKTIAFARANEVLETAVQRAGAVMVWGDFNASLHMKELFDFASDTGVSAQIGTKEGVVLARAAISDAGMVRLYRGASGDDLLVATDKEKALRDALLEQIASVPAAKVEPQPTEEKVTPKPENVPTTGVGAGERSGTADEQAAADAALAMAAQVVAELGGTFVADGFSGPGTAGAWSYGKAEVNGVAVRLAASGGGVVQVNGAPHDAAGKVIDTAEQVRASILAAAPVPQAEPVVPADSPEQAADRAYLQSLIDGTGDVLAADTGPKLEAIYAKHEADADMMALFEQAANAYGNAVAAHAKQALVSLAPA